MKAYQNPIIPGFNPDPSICRVGTDYYIVNSTFEFFPGVPIYHSSNLVNWTMLGHCLTSATQLPLEQCRPSGGIYAPTIRYHDGIFYMTTTNVSAGGNFIVHSRFPDKEWSTPVYVAQGGIDPSLLFDDDGRVYFTSAGLYAGRQCILMCELNPLTGEKLSETVPINFGCGGRYPEGPHLYKIKNKYYLMLAEGGTEFGHMETIQRADSPYGPYESCPYNPILSHREDTREQIYCTGHADLLEDENGNWWMVCLAVRPCGGKKNRLLQHNLGRETFLTPVSWTKDGWPIAGINGYIDLKMSAPLPGEAPVPATHNFHDNFDTPDFPHEYNFLRNPKLENYIRRCADRQLLLIGTQTSLNEQASPTWLGIRQKALNTSTTVKIYPQSEVQGMRLGLTAYYNDAYHYEIYLSKECDSWKVCLAKRVDDIFAVTAQLEIDSPKEKGLYLRISSDEESYSFYFSFDGKNYIKLGTGLVVGLCTEGTRTMTFTGTHLGMFAENGAVGFEDFDIQIH